MSVASLKPRGRPSADRPDAAPARTTAARVKFAAIVGFGALMGGAVVNATWLQTEHVAPQRDASVARLDEPRPAPVMRGEAPKVAVAAIAPVPEATAPATDPLPVGSIAPPPVKKAAPRHVLRPAHAKAKKKDVIAAFIAAADGGRRKTLANH